ncbi:hypothetical protein LI177_09180 [bacterium 210820-DFI.6.37]|nr:hypothetical protein [bacterium 210820-DFI.6.37]
MKTLEEQILEYKTYYHGPEPEEKKVAKTVRQSMDAFYTGQEETCLSFFEFIYKQAAFVKKQWWIGQLLLLAGLWGILYCSESGDYWQRQIGVMTPLFVLLLVPELWKNRSCASMEIEGASYFSLRQVYSARLLLFTAVDVLLLSVFFAVTACTVHIAFGEILLQFFLPFNVTCCICFRILYSKRFGSEYLVMAACLLWAGVWSWILSKEEIYAAVSRPVWAGVLILSAIYAGYSICRSLRDCDNYMEVNQAWN